MTDMNLKLIDYVLKRNEEQSQVFMDPGKRLERQRYRAEHPTEIVALKCMDGRLNLALMTDMPPGIISPYRNLGGVFDLGWPYLGRLMLDKVEYAASQGRRVLALATYHFSKGDPHRGCAGHQYDTDAARAGAFRLRGQFDEDFGMGHEVVHAIVVGIETDEDSLVFHGEEGSVFSIADNLSLSEEVVRERLRQMYPTMNRTVFADMFEMVRGNRRHVEEVKKSDRPVIDMLHKENIIAVGRGFDWFHTPNKALIVGPFAADWTNAVATEGRIVLDNLKNGRISREDGVLLLVSSPFRNIGAERKIAQRKSQHIVAKSREALALAVPELQEIMSELVVIMDENTRELAVLSRSE